VPFLLVSVVGISLFTLLHPPPDVQLALESAGSGLMGNWLWAAILYASYNILMSAAVLGPLGANARDERAVLKGGALGGLGLGLASLMIYLALSTGGLETRNLEVPLLYLAGRIAPAVGGMFALVLLAEIYTTAVGALYGFSARLIGKAGRRKTPKVAGAVIAAFFASLLGFSNLVRYLYPVQGYGGVILLAALLFAWAKGRI